MAVPDAKRDPNWEHGILFASRDGGQGQGQGQGRGRAGQAIFWEITAVHPRGVVQQKW